MRDKLGWANNNPGILSAQAKLSNDQEVQSMIELLQRANLLGPEVLHGQGLGLGLGPLTGPADHSADNLFEKSFTESPPSMMDNRLPHERLSPPPPPAEEPMSPKSFMRQDLDESSESLSRITSEDAKAATALATPTEKRSSLKRTYTDIAGLSMQNRLTDALAQPYKASDVDHASSIIRPKAVPTVFPPQHAGPHPISNNPAPHGHQRHVGANQAIFTTESTAPWTITAANDLACLVFGVTRAEVRKMGIMEVIKEERRRWLESKLRHPDHHEPPAKSEPATRLRPPQSSQSQRNSPQGSTSIAMGNGVTAKLLSKPPSTYQSRRAKTASGIVDNNNNNRPALGHMAHKSRGVLLCGDVVPIQKRNGATGSASLWVKEKHSGLIWVLEEIAEDVAYLSVDEIGCVTKGVGAIDPIWGVERVRRGMDIKKLIPELPKRTGTYTGALDYDRIAELRRFTARTANSISIPITVDRLSGQEGTLRVSSFPHIAGIMVLSSETLHVTSSNSVFSSALFGQDNPDGMHVNDLIPSFDKILHLMTDEDKIHLVDGIVIPEHSFRRARALLALREGKADAASIFLRPSGLPAKHRDGSDIMVDVQMRVVKSDRHDPAYHDSIDEEQEDEYDAQPPTEVVYALWITYSRQLHAVNHGVGPVNPLVSRPGTPPHQPSPGQPTPEAIDGETLSPSPTQDAAPVSLLTQQLQEASTSSMTTGAEGEPFEHPSPDALAAGAQIIKKKAIADFLILEEMGQGAYGQVKLARYKRANAKKMCIKYVTKRRILVDTWTRDRRLGTVPLEIHVLDYLRRDGLQHPNIVEMADFFEDDVNYYIEMIPHGLPGMDLFDYIELRVNMEERECRKIFVQVANALHHLHVKAKVVHRDIKDENVILDGDGAVKLVDFGSAAYIKSGPFDVFVGTIGTFLFSHPRPQSLSPCLPSSPLPNPPSVSAHAPTNLHQTDYAAPEVLRGSPYRGKEQDVWALGILLYTIVYKENPFYSIDEIMDHDLRVPYVMSEDCIDLIRKMLDRNVERRIGIQAVLEHPWCQRVEEEEE